LFDAPVQLLKVEGLAVLVSSYRGLLSDDRVHEAVTHHQVVRSIQKQTTSLPVRFGTIVTEQQLREFISTNRQAISANLAHVRGRVEMNVRMSGTIASADPAKPTENETRTAGPGTAFLLEKRREIVHEETREQQKTVLSTWFREKLGHLVKDEHLNFVLAPSHRAFLGRADHLVDGENVQEYRERMAKAVEERPEIHFMVSGPWPPYSFANIELEFKSHFGVS
jgi:gas vesicle protein GvpL/GvpF